jgi:hypothetical protein
VDQSEQATHNHGGDKARPVDVGVAAFPELDHFTKLQGACAWREGLEIIKREERGWTCEGMDTQLQFGQRDPKPAIQFISPRL